MLLFQNVSSLYMESVYLPFCAKNTKKGISNLVGHLDVHSSKTSFYRPSLSNVSSYKSVTSMLGGNDEEVND